MADFRTLKAPYEHIEKEDNLTARIEDPIFEETYTATIKQKSTGWCGWIPDIPRVQCEAETKAELLTKLASSLHEALVAEEEAWEKQFEEDVKAGRLDALSEKAIQNYKEGRYRDLDSLIGKPKNM